MQNEENLIVLALFPGSPLAPMKIEKKGRAWYRFARDTAARPRNGNNCLSRDVSLGFVIVR